MKKTSLACVAALLGIAAPAVAADFSPLMKKAAPTFTGLGTAGPAKDGFMVTFSDRPGQREAVRRLGDLGAVTPLIAEAGVWQVMPRRNPSAAIARARGRSGVEAAEWPLIRRAAVRTRPPAPLAPVDMGPVNEPLQAQQWGLISTGWDPSIAGRTPRPTIAILDSGIARDHPEWGGPESPLIRGFSTFRKGSGSQANDWGITGHGTHVAGIAAAPANGKGIVGMAPGHPEGARVMPVQVADRFGDFTDRDLIRGIRYAVNNGARVINISAGGPGSLVAFQRTVLWATQRRAVIVAAVGNEGEGANPLNYPAAYPRVIGVGALCGRATNSSCPRPYQVARYSNHNQSVDLVAPGDGILSTVPMSHGGEFVERGYGVKDGTSMATPFVAGAAALVQAANGNQLSPFQVARHLRNTADPMGRRGRNDRRGYGALDVRAAVTRQVGADDVGEVNDDIPYVIRRAPIRLAIGARPHVIDADIDQFDDVEDIYPVTLRAGARLRIELTAPRGRQSIYLWGPRTRTVATGPINMRRICSRSKPPHGVERRWCTGFRVPAVTT